ncbi:MAG: hypothetical protein A4E56_00618 [Pelotomaculum sp. PtaU1.Bin065]|nr:MAG: hypothetical protein A4E56_00618 [Pelotomaculum sp. PtaU1.Bin065]
MVEQFDARKTIECLRSGVSSGHLSAIFSYGREAALERVGRELTRVQSGAGVISLVVKGNFGNGKTHFLNIIARKAEEMNFAVSFVPLSKETPFDKMDRLYRRAAANLLLPGYTQPGFAPLLEGLKRDRMKAEEVLKYAGHNLHPKIEAVLRNYLESDSDMYNQHVLLGDLAGDFIPVTQLRSINRMNFGNTLSISRFTVKENTFDYFRFLAYLIRAGGCAGWVILFDEFEQLMYLGIMARANAYLNAARFMSPSFGMTAAYTVFSASSNLWSELIWRQKNSDYDTVPQKLAAKERQHEIPTVREVLGSFLKDNLFLDKLSTFDVNRMLWSVREYHAQAYDWPAPVDIDRVAASLAGDKPLRTAIRSMVEYLDLQYLYDEQPDIKAGMPEEILPVKPAGDEDKLEPAIPEG